MPSRRNRLRPQAGFADAGLLLPLHTRSPSQSDYGAFVAPEEWDSNVAKKQSGIAEVRLNDGQIPQLEAHPAHLLPSVAAVPDAARIERFRRTIYTGLHQHSLIATTLTSGLLVVLLFLGALNPTVYSGIICYLIGTYSSAIVFSHAIRNATYSDELETISKRV